MLTSTSKFADTRPADSTIVRAHLVEALNLDLLGPDAGHNLGSEHLPEDLGRA